MSPAEACARATADFIRARPFTNMAVSGGSTPRAMFQILAKLDVDWDRVGFYWVDERCVPPEHPDSNYGMTATALLQPAGIPPANVHRMEGELDPHEAAIRYAAKLPGRFDLIHMGVGDDAHTASLFPGSPLTEDRQRLVAAVYVEKKSIWRITLLPKMILDAEACFVLLTGESKRKALGDVMNQPLDVKQYPAQLILRLRQSRVFTDL